MVDGGVDEGVDEDVVDDVVVEDADTELAAKKAAILNLVISA